LGIKWIPLLTNCVLIVDDNEMVRRGLRCLFESEPAFKVCGEAVDGRDAIEKARELKPDLIVLDFSMPGMNGLESARILSNMKPSAMILLFTMHRNVVADGDARAAGINAVVSKSEGAGTLISQAQTLLGLS
jgi:DNA-binding NarL/FixJ family response regulator